MAIGILIVILVMAVLALAALAARRRTPSGGEAVAFLQAHGAPDTADAVSFAARYLDRRTSLRWNCAVLAVLAVNVVGFVVNDDPTIRIDLYPIMGAYVVGTLVAELRLARSRGSVARASLTARTVEQYLGSTWLGVQRLATLVAALGWGSTLLLDRDASTAPSATDAGLYVLAVLIVGLGAEWAQRRIVSQPQPGAAPDLVAADDAVRTSSVHAVAGAAIGFLVMTAAGALFVLSDGMTVLAVLGVLLGLFLWYRCAQPVGSSRRVVLAAVGVVAVVAVAGVSAVLLLRSAGSGADSQPGIPKPLGEPVVAEPATATTMP